MDGTATTPMTLAKKSDIKPITIRIPKVPTTTNAEQLKCEVSSAMPTTSASLGAIKPNSPSVETLRAREFALLLSMVPNDKVGCLVDILTSSMGAHVKNSILQGDQVSVSVMFISHATWQRLWEFANQFSAI